MIYIFTVTPYKDKYITDGTIGFNWAERTCRFFDTETKKYVTIPVEDIDYIAYQKPAN
jgi:hypothetical protein